jgi:hypothetical protein
MDSRISKPKKQDFSFISKADVMSYHHDYTYRGRKDDSDEEVRICGNKILEGARNDKYIGDSQKIQREKLKSLEQNTQKTKRSHDNIPVKDSTQSCLEWSQALGLEKDARKQPNFQVVEEYQSGSEDSVSKPTKCRLTRKVNKFPDERHLIQDHREISNVEEEARQKGHSYQLERVKQGERNRELNDKRNDTEGEISKRKEDEQITKRREYNVYEDWRILEAIEDFIKKNGMKGATSKNLWIRLNDPQTELPLLLGQRSSESMRERYKRQLVRLNAEEIEVVRIFAKEHTIDEMKCHQCLFTKKKFMGIGTGPISSPFKSSRKVLYSIVRFPVNTEKNGQLERSRQNSEKKPMEQKFQTLLREKNKKSGSSNKFEKTRTSLCDGTSSFHERIKNKQIISLSSSHEEPGENSISNNLSEIERLVHQPTSKKEKKLRYRIDPDNDEIEFWQKKKVKQALYSSPEENWIPSEDINENTNRFPKRNFNRRNEGETEDDDEMGEVAQKRKEKGRKPSYYPRKEFYEEVDSQDSELEEKKGEDLNIMIYANYEEGFREFLKEKPDKEDLKVKTEEIRLVKLAKKYNIPLDQALKLFDQVSCDYSDLEEYLNTGNQNILWSKDDDHGLIIECAITMRYLKKLKGEKRIERRKDYLLREYFKKKTC